MSGLQNVRSSKRPVAKKTSIYILSLWLVEIRRFCCSHVCRLCFILYFRGGGGFIHMCTYIYVMYIYAHERMYVLHTYNVHVCTYTYTYRRFTLANLLKTSLNCACTHVRICNVTCLHNTHIYASYLWLMSNRLDCVRSKHKYTYISTTRH
jgi:hypothetical protein